MKTTTNNCATIPPAFAVRLFASIPIPVGCWSASGEALYCSQAFLDFFSVKSLEEYRLNHISFSPVTQPDGQHSLELARQHFKTALKVGYCNFTWVHHLPQGEVKYVEYNLTRMSHEGEDIIVSYLYESQHLKNTITHYHEVGQRDRALFESSPSSICLWDADLNLVDCNAEALRLFNFKTKETLKKHLTDLYPPYQANGMTSYEKAQHLLSLTLRDGYCQDEWLYLTHDGDPLPTEVTLVRVDVDGVSLIAEHSRDLRELRASQLQSQRAEERIQAMFDSMPMGVSLWNKNYQLVDCNKEALQLFGFQNKQELLDNVQACLPELQPCGRPSFELIPKLIDTAFEQGTLTTSWNFQTKDGETIPSELFLIRVNIHDEYMVAAYLRDMRELIASEAREREATERAQVMLDATPLCANFWSSEFKNIDCNMAAAKLFDLKDKQEYLERFFELSPEYQPDGRLSAESALEKITTAFQEGYCRFEWLHIKLDGERIPAEITLIRVPYRDNYIVVGYTRDLRELKAMEQQTKAAEDRAQAMLDSFPMGANFWDNDFELIDCNMEMVNLYGFDNKEAYLENFYKLYPEYQPNGTRSSEAAWEHFNIALKEGYYRNEWMCQQPETGAPIPVEVTLVRIVHQEKYAIVSYMRDLREHKAMLQEIHKNEEELRKARDVAEQSTKTKSEFLANMSHEIRTPMNGILGLLHLLEKTDLKETQKNYVQKTLYSANNLLRIINDILDFSKIEAGKMEMEQIPFSLCDIGNDLYSLFAPKTAEKGLALVIHEFKLDTLLIGDPLRLKQVLFNLVSNAIKFTEQGAITVSLDAAEQKDCKIYCKFSVSDTGIGLSQEHIDRLFSAFSQADTSVTRKYGGTGLGLAICKKIVEMMGGSIAVKSHEGEGSKFYFSTIFDTSSDSRTSTEQSSLQQQEAPLAQGTHYEGHLLLVEDNEINQIIAEELLHEVGYTLDIANNGLEALAMIKKQHYIAILMDIQMPVMDGLTAAQKIREQKEFDFIPVIAMSAHAMQGDKDISLAHGMNDHITKPIDPEMLYKTLDYWIKKFTNQK